MATANHTGLLTANPNYYRDRDAKNVAAKAAGIPTRVVAGIEVESACPLQSDDPWTAWLAALIEGEGYFDKSRAVIRIGMCDKDVIECAMRVSGVGTIIGPLSTRSPKHKPIWVWRVSRAADCWVLCHLMLPYLGERRTKEALHQCGLYTGTAGKVIHGTRSYYQRGCRCSQCIDAQRAYRRKRVSA